MNWLSWLSDFFSAPDHRSGPDSIVHRIAEHLAFSGEALLFAALIAVPLGLLIGYTGRGVTDHDGVAGRPQDPVPSARHHHLGQLGRSER
ncbi:hypothetical protein AB0O00_26735, partial [Kitasatospora sp. NPDC093558]